jgi:hypothetical protein
MRPLALLGITDPTSEGLPHQRFVMVRRPANAASAFEPSGVWCDRSLRHTILLSSLRFSAPDHLVYKLSFFVGYIWH